jgi:glycerophosphoryl diester phosphodiesterase
MRRPSVLFLTILVACGEAEQASDSDTSSECCAFADNRVIAHRGAWKGSGLPENSIAAMQHAFELGCEGSEFDVWMTADGVLVVNHDPTFFELPVEESTYEELLAQPLSNGEPIPTAEEMLLEGMTQVTTKLIFEIKPSQVGTARSLELATKSVELVHELDAQDWVNYISFDYDILQRILEIDPDARVAYLDGSTGPQRLHDDGFYGAAYHFAVYQQDPGLIDEAKALGLTINAWTVNAMDMMQWLIDADADYITTDEPELLLSLTSRARQRPQADTER